MALWRLTKGELKPLLPAGILQHDLSALSDYQLECIKRFYLPMRTDNEKYLLKHKEIRAMLLIFLAKMAKQSKRKDKLEDTALHFTRPAAELEAEIREFLNLAPDAPYCVDETPTYCDDPDLCEDLNEILKKHSPRMPMREPTPEVNSLHTLSSSFISILTSEITLPTPESIPTPEPTISKLLFKMVSTAVDKAIFSQVTDEDIRYDTAYVELQTAVEVAMEIPVIEIRADIADLLDMALHLFDILIDEKDRIAAEIAWERRMRKKLKRTLRWHRNFKGYETLVRPPKSMISSHESNKKPPPRPCEQPQFNYNRYPKDRFGIYLLRKTEFSNKTITNFIEVTMENFLGPNNEMNIADIDAMSIKSGVTTRSSSTIKTLKSDKFMI